MQDRDNLERFVSENREAFDTNKPTDKVWNNISQALDKQDQESPRLWYWKAAVILLLGAVSFLMIDKFKAPIEEVPEEAVIQQASNLEKFQDLEFFYTSIISEKREKLSEELMDDEKLFNYIEADMQALDEIYTELKDVFLESQQSEEVLERLLHVLRQKIHLVNSQLEIIAREKLPQQIKESVDLSSI